MGELPQERIPWGRHLPKEDNVVSGEDNVPNKEVTGESSLFNPIQKWVCAPKLYSKMSKAFTVSAPEERMELGIAMEE